MKLSIYLSLVIIITLHYEVMSAKIFQCVCTNISSYYEPDKTFRIYNELNSFQENPTFTANYLPLCASSNDFCLDLDYFFTTTVEPYDNGGSTCGIRSGKSRKSKKATKATAERGEFPWMVAVLQKYYPHRLIHIPKYRYHCGGSLVNKQAVLTSAKEVYQLRADNLTVRVGERHWITSHKHPRDLEVRAIHVHPDFDPKFDNHNYALLILAKPAKLNAKVNTICLPSSSNDYEPHDCIETGWGGDRVDKDNRIGWLKKSNISLLNRSACSRVYIGTDGQDHNRPMHYTNLCADDDHPGHPCTGNGGSPLICRKKNDTNRYVQVGILVKPECKEPVKGGLYADATAALPWIIKQIEHSLG